MRKKAWFALGLLGALSMSAVAEVYTWSGATDGDWYTGGNWTTASANATPKAATDAGVGNTSDVVINTTVNLDQYIRFQPTFIRSLTIGADSDGAYSLGLRAANGVARDLTFEADSGNASLTVASDSTGDKTFGMYQGSLTLGDLVLNSNLDVTHNGDGNLIFLSEIRGAGNLSIAGAGTTVMSGLNTYSGNTTLDAASTLTLSDGGQLTFSIGESGVNNSLSGSGSVNLDGKLLINLTGASSTPGSQWQIMDVDALSETFGATFTVSSTLGNFANSGGVWSINENGVDYEFLEASGLLYVPANDVFFQVTPTAVAMSFPAALSLVTGSVDMVYYSTENMDLTITISDESHPGSFSVLGGASQTLTDVSPAVNPLSFELDNTVANLAGGETATGLVTIAWAESGGAGTNGQVIVPISAASVASTFEIAPTELAMVLQPPANKVTGLVEAVYYSHTDMDVTITVSDETHPGSFSVLGGSSQTLTNLTPSVNPISFEFDNTVANMAVGATATGLVTIAWAESGGGANGQIIMPISSILMATAGTNIWNGLGDGVNWGDAANWSLTRVPGVLGADWGIIESGGSVAVSSDFTGAFSWDTSVRSSSTLNIAADFLNAGTLTIGTDAADYAFVNQTTGDVAVTTLSMGNASAASNSVYTLSGGSVTTSGELVIDAGGVMEVSGGDLTTVGIVDINAGGTLKVTGGSVNLATSALQNGMGVSMAPGSVLEISGGTYYQYSRIWCDAGSTIRVVGSTADITFRQVMTGRFFADIEFVLDATGVSTIKNSAWGKLLDTTFKIDGAAYTGGPQEILLYTSASATDEPLGEDYAVTNLGVEGVDWEIIETTTAPHTITLKILGALTYENWAAGHGLSGDDALETADVDLPAPDGMNNLLEYALGGNPTIDDADTVLPVSYMDSGYMYYISDQRVGDPNLTFSVGTATMLMNPLSWNTSDVELVGESVETNSFKTVTNRTEMAEGAKFITVEVSVE